MINNIKDEVYKCSKCGLCQSVCPLYLATKNEMLLARGRYIILNNFFNNGKKLKNSFIKNLDICLNCNACTDFCPSSINACDIFTKLKEIYNYKYGILNFFFIFFCFLFFHKLLKKDILIKRKKIIKDSSNKKKLVFFQGCMNKYVNSSDKNAVLNVLDKLNYNVISISENCCGLPYLSDGRISLFKKNAEKIVKSIPKDVKYIVCSCDSCYETLNKIDEISNKLIRLDEILKINNIEIAFPDNVVYHKPFSRKSVFSYEDKVAVINKKGSCSLMENFFILKYKKLAKKLIDTVFYKKEEIDNKLILTTCQLSKYGLNKGIKEIGSNAKVISYAEYVDSINSFL